MGGEHGGRSEFRNLPQIQSYSPYSCFQFMYITKTSFQFRIVNYKVIAWIAESNYCTDSSALGFAK